MNVSKGIKLRVNMTNVLVMCALMLFLGSSSAAAGWRIDGARFSQSVHSDTSCVECHTGIEGLSRHPEPANVRKKMSDFFKPETCLECHDDIAGQIENDAQHGGQAVDSAERFFNCIGCHDPHYQGAPEQVLEVEAVDFSEDDAVCMECHQAVKMKDADAKNREFCFTCHAADKNMPQSVPVMNLEQYAKTPHAAEDCMTCHPMAAQYEHHMQTPEACTQCHSRHEESVAHETHAGVSCQACHLGDVVPIRDTGTHEIVWERTAVSGTVSNLHNLIKPDGEGCTRCHFSGNTIGAAAMVLPAKGVLCMPCHTATISASDTTSIISLFIFVIGMLSFMSIWFSGTFAGDTGAGFLGNAARSLVAGLKAVFSPKLGKILSTIWYDVLLQRRLYQRSPKRWFIHALIFWPFAIRFVWGVAGLIATNWMKGWPLGWALINKNHAFTAFVFDLTGVCLIIGIVMAFTRGSEAQKNRTQGLPQQDRLALILIGAIALVGFVLEGMRIAMTGAQDPAGWALIGYGISKLFAGMEGLTQVYGYLWYLHAILTGAFVAYLPFSKMMHIIMAPIVLAMNAATKEDHH